MADQPTNTDTNNTASSGPTASNTSNASTAPNAFTDSSGSSGSASSPLPTDNEKTSSGEHWDDQLSLSPELRNNCRTIFIDCNEFSNAERLSSILKGTDGVTELVQSLSMEKAIDALVDSFLGLVIPKKLPDKTPMLVFFIKSVLSPRYNKPHKRRDELDDLADRIEKEFKSKRSSANADRKVREAAYNNYPASDTPHKNNATSDTSHETDTNVESWFDGAGDDLKDRALRISLAVFNGAPMHMVIAASDDLYERIKPPDSVAPTAPQNASSQSNPPSPPTPTSFAPSLFANQNKVSARIRRAEATVTTQNSLDGPIQVVNLDNSAYPLALLKMLWEDYPDVQANLIAWLSDWSSQGTANMRIRAATAVGVLCTINFTMLRPVLFDWAKQDGRMYRSAIANALGKAVESESAQQPVLEMLRRWTDSDDAELRWAAARSFTTVGIRYPADAFACWQSIIGSASNDQISIALSLGLLDSTLNAITTMLDDAVGQPKYFLKVFEQAAKSVLAWLKSNHVPTALVAASLFVPLAVAAPDLSRDEAAADNTNNGTTQKPPDAAAPANMPIMLKLGTDENTSYRAAIKELFQHVLLSTSLEETGKSVLEHWFTTINSSAKSDAYLIRFLRDMRLDLFVSSAQKDRLMDRLERYINNWATRPRQPIPTAQRIKAKMLR